MLLVLLLAGCCFASPFDYFDISETSGVQSFGLNFNTDLAQYESIALYSVLFQFNATLIGPMPQGVLFSASFECQLNGSSTNMYYVIDGVVTPYAATTFVELLGVGFYSSSIIPGVSMCQLPIDMFSQDNSVQIVSPWILLTVPRPPIATSKKGGLSSESVILIAALIPGGVVVIGAIVVLLCLCKRKRKRVVPMSVDVPIVPAPKNVTPPPVVEPPPVKRVPKPPNYTSSLPQLR